MNFQLMVNSSPINKIGKSLAVSFNLDGVLKEDCSVIDPVITVSYIDSSIVSSNYAYIPDFKRYYFIKNITSIRNSVWQISMHVDVLQSYQTEILAQTAVIKRQENSWNLYLDDGIFKTYQNPNIITKVFPNGFTTQNFVLAVAGGH